MKSCWPSVFFRSLTALALTACSVGAQAQAFPSKAVRMVVPYGTGGPSDIVARVLADEMAKALGQPVVVDNKPGAGSMVGTEIVVRSPADGYTVLLTDLPVTIVPHVLKATAKYDPVKDLEPVSLIGGSTLAFFAGEAFPARTLAEFVTTAKSRPEGVRIASGGNGSLTHLMAEVFAQSAGFKMIHVPYQGTGPAMPDLLGGRIDGMFNGYLATQSFLQSGKVKALAAASRNRVAELPNVPTFAESGMGSVSVDYWLGLVGPAGMPPAVTDALRAALAKALESASVKERFTNLAITATKDYSAKALKTALTDDFKRWGDVVRERNITVN